MRFFNRVYFSLFYQFQRTKRVIRDPRSVSTHSKRQIVTVTVAATASPPLRFPLPHRVLPRTSNCLGYNFVGITVAFVRLYRIDVLVWNDRRSRWRTSLPEVHEASPSYLSRLIWRKVCLIFYIFLHELCKVKTNLKISLWCRIGDSSTPTANVREYARVGKSSCQSRSGNALSTASSSSGIDTKHR